MKTYLLHIVILGMYSIFMLILDLEHPELMHAPHVFHWIKEEKLKFYKKVGFVKNTKTVSWKECTCT